MFERENNNFCTFVTCGPPMVETEGEQINNNAFPCQKYLASRSKLYCFPYYPQLHALTQVELSKILLNDLLKFRKSKS